MFPFLWKDPRLPAKITLPRMSFPREELARLIFGAIISNHGSRSLLLE